VNKETETSTITNNEATEEPDEVYEELDSESEISEEENCMHTRTRRIVFTSRGKQDSIVNK